MDGRAKEAWGTGDREIEGERRDSSTAWEDLRLLLENFLLKGHGIHKEPMLRGGNWVGSNHKQIGSI